MDKTRKEKIEKNVTRYVKAWVVMCELENELELLENETAEAASLLYKDRPKEYIKGMIRIVKQKEIEDSEDIECSVALGDAYGQLLFDARLWLKHYDSFIEERISRSSPYQKAMLKGEVE